VIHRRHGREQFLGSHCLHLRTDRLVGRVPSRQPHFQVIIGERFRQYLVSRASVRRGCNLFDPSRVVE
jgi:hypothetical protein